MVQLLVRALANQRLDNKSSYPRELYVALGY